MTGRAMAAGRAALAQRTARKRKSNELASLHEKPGHEYFAASRGLLGKRLPCPRQESHSDRCLREHQEKLDRKRAAAKQKAAEKRAALQLQQQQAAAAAAAAKKAARQLQRQQAAAAAAAAAAKKAARQLQRQQAAAAAAVAAAAVAAHPPHPHQPAAAVVQHVPRLLQPAAAAVATMDDDEDDDDVDGHDDGGAGQQLQQAGNLQPAANGAAAAPQQHNVRAAQAGDAAAKAAAEMGVRAILDAFGKGLSIAGLRSRFFSSIPAYFALFNGGEEMSVDKDGTQLIGGSLSVRDQMTRAQFSQIGHVPGQLRPATICRLPDGTSRVMLHLSKKGAADLVAKGFTVSPYGPIYVQYPICDDHVEREAIDLVLSVGTSFHLYGFPPSLLKGGLTALVRSLRGRFHQLTRNSARLSFESVADSSRAAALIHGCWARGDVLSVFP